MRRLTLAPRCFGDKGDVEDITEGKITYTPTLCRTFVVLRDLGGPAGPTTYTADADTPRQPTLSLRSSLTTLGTT